MYPKDAITKWTEIVGLSDTIIAPGTSPKTILSVQMQQENVASLTDLRCGSEVVARNYAKDFPFVVMNYECNNTINIQKTGNDKASVIVTYVPYLTKNATSTGLNYNPTTNIASSTDIQVYGSFSAGELVLSFLIFLLIVIELGKIISRGLGLIKTKRSFIRYKDSDVEVTDDII